MNLENQVCNLELAKKLKELGITQNNLWHWDIENNAVRWGKDVSEYGHDLKEYCSAFTSAELGEMLPFDTRTEKDNVVGWEGKYFHKKDTTHNIQIFNDKTEANTRAKMLIWLIENKYLKI